MEELPSLTTLSVSRDLKPPEFGKPTNIQLHYLPDDSEYGCGVHLSDYRMIVENTLVTGYFEVKGSTHESSVDTEA